MKRELDRDKKAVLTFLHTITPQRLNCETPLVIDQQKNPETTSSSTLLEFSQTTTVLSIENVKTVVVGTKLDSSLENSRSALVSIWKSAVNIRRAKSFNSSITDIETHKSLPSSSTHVSSGH